MVDGELKSPKARQGQKSGLGFLTVYKGDGNMGEGELDAWGAENHQALRDRKVREKGMCRSFLV